MEEAWVAAGVLRKPFGREGAIHFDAFAGEVRHLIGVQGELRPGDEAVRVADARSHGKGFVIRLDGCDSIEQAQQRSGRELWISRTVAAPCEQDEHYISDLVGLEVHCAGKPVGSVHSVWSTGAADYLEVRREDGQIRHVPFLKRFVSAPAEGSIEILEPELLE